MIMPAKMFGAMGVWTSRSHDSDPPGEPVSSRP